MHVLRPLLVVIVFVTACGEPAAPPPTAPTATASLEVPPLPPPKASAEKPVVRQAPPPTTDDDESSPLPRDPAAAEAAFNDARQAMSAGDMAKARVLLIKSQRLDPAVGTLLNLAICEERLGLREEAIRHYQAAYDASMKEGRTDRAAVAKDRMDALRNRP